MINSINLGFHHFSRKSAVAITEVMSNLMHETLLNSLISNKSPVTMILYGSTDASSKIHSMIVIVYKSINLFL